MEGALQMRQLLHVLLYLLILLLETSSCQEEGL